MVVEHRLVDRDRERLVRAEADRVRELPLVVDAVELEDADADPVRGDAEADAAAGKLVLREELVERRRERRDVPHLAADDDARLERLARELEQLRRPPLLTTRAAAICDAPIFRPTISCFRAACLRAAGRLARRAPSSSSAAGRGPTA